MHNRPQTLEMLFHDKKMLDKPLKIIKNKNLKY